MKSRLRINRNALVTVIVGVVCCWDWGNYCWALWPDRASQQTDTYEKYLLDQSNEFFALQNENVVKKRMNLVNPGIPAEVILGTNNQKMLNPTQQIGTRISPLLPTEPTIGNIPVKGNIGDKNENSVLDPGERWEIETQKNGFLGVGKWRAIYKNEEGEIKIDVKLGKDKKITNAELARLMNGESVEFDGHLVTLKFTVIYKKMTFNSMDEQIETLIHLLGNEDDQVRSLTQKELIHLGEPIVEPLLNALARFDLSVDVKYQIVGTLINMDQLTISHLIKFLKDKDKNSWSGYPYVEMVLHNIVMNQWKQALKNDVKERFGIKIDEKFSGRAVWLLSNVLNQLPHELIDGVTYIQRMLIFFPWLPMHGVYSDDDKAISVFDELSMSNTLLLRIFFHEFAHAIDHMKYNLKAFEPLHKESISDEDFAYDYGTTNHIEDFATTFEFYTVDSIQNFLRGINQAKQGKNVYLKKLLFVLNIFTTGHADHAILYKTDEQAIKKIRVNVGRDSNGQIVSIDNVSINDLDGLEKVFIRFSQFFSS